MEAQYRNQLPAAVVPLVEEIETAAGCEILVCRDPASPTPQYARAEHIEGRWRPVIGIRESFDYCDGPGGIYPEPYSVATHELLHLHRYFVERVPGLDWTAELARLEDGCAPGDDLATHQFSPSGIESALEHLVIEQRMPQYGFAPDHAWYGPRWSERPYRKLGPVLRRWGYLQLWLQTQYLSTVGARKRAETVMLEENLIGGAMALLDNVSRMIGAPGALYVAAEPDRQKEALAMLFIRAAGLPPWQARFVYYLRDGSRAVRPIPAETSFLDWQGRRVRVEVRDSTGGLAHWIADARPPEG